MLQVGASSRRRAMALRWRNRPTAAQRSRTMTWKVGPPRILCLSLSPLEKKKKSSILALLLLARFFFMPLPSLRSLKSMRGQFSKIGGFWIPPPIFVSSYHLSRAWLYRERVQRGSFCPFSPLSMTPLLPPFSSVECALGIRCDWSNRSGYCALFCFKGTVWGCYRY